MRGLGNPVAFHLTAGHSGDVPQAPALVAGLAARVVMADGDYDARQFRDIIAGMGALAVIPDPPRRASKYPFDRQLCRERHLVECCFSRLKRFRRIATHFEKTARNYLAVATLAATILWLR